VNVYIPGCPPRPQALIYGILLAISKIWFKKLIKEVGIRKAIEIMKEKRITYSGDFIVDHVNDPIFSTPYLTPKELSIGILTSNIAPEEASISAVT
jgi:hypothetical protein